MKELTMEDIVNYCKQYGFVYPGSEIYGGFANTWDFGPLGSRMINNIKDCWRKRFVQQRDNSYEIDCGIIMNPKVWEASGHAKSFNDPQVDCKECKKRFRADNLISLVDPEVKPDLLNYEEMNQYIHDNMKCPNCGKMNFTNVREFDLMFKTYRGTVSDNKQEIYLRPETCQGEYINFLNVLRTTRQKLPLTIAQVGKSFRNEVTPGNFLFRTIEFEQMELQTFCKPGEDEEIFNYNKEQSMNFLTDLGMDSQNLRFKDHDKLVFYASAATDIQYHFPMGWDELWGIHNRTNYDLTQHSKYSGKDLSYLDTETNEKYIPYILETAAGVGRMMLAFICDALTEEVLEDGSTREVLKLHHALAPYKVAVLPLIKKVHSKKAYEVYNKLNNYFMCTIDEASSIGKRYRRQDAIGTPFCITIDDNTLENNIVTVRNRDTMEQMTMNIDDVPYYVIEKMMF